jgi:hypothetical protein
VRKIYAEANEISSPYHCLTNSLPSTGEFIFLHNCWMEFYEPGVISEVCGNAKMIRVGLSGSAQNWVNVSRIALWRQTVTLDNIGDARSEWHSKEQVDILNNE